MKHALIINQQEPSNTDIMNLLLNMQKQIDVNTRAVQQLLGLREQTENNTTAIQQLRLDMNFRFEQTITKDYLEERLATLKDAIFIRLDHFAKLMIDQRDERVAMIARLDRHEEDIVTLKQVTGVV